MTQGELFAGIGGFGLAGRWAGIESVFQVEWNEYCQKILRKNFPNAQIFGDIKQFDGTPFRGAIDIISGGFPCQPYSTAGKRLGKEDERHLWPEMLRVIREVAPRWVVGENVFGLVNWSGGLVFDEVQSDLEASGYEVQAFVLPAASTNAPHIRQRVWFVAHADSYANSANCGTNEQKDSIQAIDRQEVVCSGDVDRTVNAAHAERLQGIERHKSETIRGRAGEAEQIRVGGEFPSDANDERREKRHNPGIAAIPGFDTRSNFNEWSEWPTQPAVCGRNDGVSNRVDRITALGNAIVPQVAYRIFDTIRQYEAAQMSP